MLTEEQAKQLKAQLFKQLGNLPPEQRQAIRNQIESMNSEEFEQFLIKNGMIKQEREEKGKDECVFCSILEGKVSSYKLDENKTSLAILEINPLSKGHSLVISKKHDRLSNSAFSLANKLSRKIKSKFKPEDVKIENARIMEHNLIQIIPIYKNEKLEKKKVSEKELILLQDKLQARKKEKKQKQMRQEQATISKAPRRFP